MPKKITVRKYGARLVGDASVIDASMRAQNRLWNALVEIERGNRAQYREIVTAADDELASLTAQYQQGETIIEALRSELIVATQWSGPCGGRARSARPTSKPWPNRPSRRRWQRRPARPASHTARRERAEAGQSGAGPGSMAAARAALSRPTAGPPRWQSANAGAWAWRAWM